MGSRAWTGASVRVETQKRAGVPVWLSTVALLLSTIETLCIRSWTGPWATLAILFGLAARLATVKRLSQGLQQRLQPAQEPGVNLTDNRLDDN